MVINGSCPQFYSTATDSNDHNIIAGPSVQGPQQVKSWSHFFAERHVYPFQEDPRSRRGYLSC